MSKTYYVKGYVKAIIYIDTEIQASNNKDDETIIERVTDNLRNILGSVDVTSHELEIT